LPTSGIVNADLTPGTWEYMIDWLKHLILPVAVLRIRNHPGAALQRSSLLEVLRQDY
jgi:peptide/nickel transport system permease protein